MSWNASAADIAWLYGPGHPRVAGADSLTAVSWDRAPLDSGANCPMNVEMWPGDLRLAEQRGFLWAIASFRH